MDSFPRRVSTKHSTFQHHQTPSSQEANEARGQGLLHGSVELIFHKVLATMKIHPSEDDASTNGIFTCWYGRSDAFHQNDLLGKVHVTVTSSKMTEKSCVEVEVHPNYCSCANMNPQGSPKPSVPVQEN